MSNFGSQELVTVCECATHGVTVQLLLQCVHPHTVQTQRARVAAQCVEVSCLLVLGRKIGMVGGPRGVASQ